MIANPMSTAASTARDIEAARIALADENDADAGRLCRRVLELVPNDPEAMAILGVVMARGENEVANGIALLEEACAHRPDVAHWWNNLAGLHRTARNFTAALHCAREAVRLVPGSAIYHLNLARVLGDSGDDDQAIGALLAALVFDPDCIDAHLVLGETLLARGEMRAGWAEYEWLHKTGRWFAVLPRMVAPIWNGVVLPRGRIVLIGDQGLGDTMQFARYIPQVAARCHEVIVMCSREVVPLLHGMPGAALVTDRWEDVPPHTAYCRMSGLPRLFGTEIDTIPAPVPYLAADPVRTLYWADRLRTTLPSSQLRVGLVWAGNPRHPNDAQRSLALPQLAPLTDQADVSFVALQVPVPTRDKATLASLPNVLDLSADLADFGETASVIENLDLIIMVDSSVAHLAGALGKPVWVLLPHRSDWRWMKERTDTPWYPTMKLYRQTADREWHEPLAAAAKALHDLVAGRTIGTNPHAVSARQDHAGLLARARTAFLEHRYQDVVTLCAVLRTTAPDDPDVIGLLGTALRHLGDTAQAVQLLERARDACPTDANWHNNLGNAYRDAFRLDDALASMQAALAIDPGSVLYRLNLAVIHVDRSDDAAAIEAYLTALAHDRGDSAAHLGLGTLLLSHGEMRAGWAEFEQRRWKLHRMETPKWNGMRLPRGRILLIDDQGYGDMLQFARYIPQVAARCHEVVLNCPAALAPLLSTVPGVARCCDNWRDVPPHTAYARLSSLPRIFATDLDTIPDDIPYITAPAAPAAQWRDRLDAALGPARPRVGLVWAGNPAHTNDARRSLKLRQIAPILANPGIAFVSLQTPVPAADHPDLSAATNVIDLAAELGNFIDTAAIIAALDLVITVDTAVAHLAGAMGKPVWVLVSEPADWRWLRHREDSPWYPTLRIFRQPRPGAWDDAIKAVVIALNMEIRLQGSVR